MFPLLHHYFSPFTKGRSNHGILKLSGSHRINNGISGQKKIELTKLLQVLFNVCFQRKAFLKKKCERINLQITVHN
ncbi:hypothetical protein BDA96_10G180800 [Sorghum bicolor]|uniref:Uncharacterized protein n=1 Tax=Sorghum bicolor TaxID=4558 RepID=A0A921Q3Q5_SORBI|nr:hypothetical protein BDA96_10G180800 [Sorghum bicolor]